MKEEYFTASTIDNKGKELFLKFKHYREGKKYSFQITKSALLLLDIQNYFFRKSSHAFIPSAPPIIKNIQKLMDLFIDNNRPIIITRHINTVKNSGQMSKWWKDLIKEQSSSSHIIKEIQEKILNGNLISILKKTQYDAFYKTSLEETLRNHKIKQIVICGVMTHLCCETTARNAFIRDFDVFFTIDCTATYNEAFHTASILNLAHGFVIPVLTKELLNAETN
ncbi:MAG: isochorismatase family protein [Candidatus Hodarchaeales archaeon]|jgi:isochorismate hydrolase